MFRTKDFSVAEKQVMQAALTSYLGRSRPTPNRAIANRLRNEFRATLFKGTENAN